MKKRNLFIFLIVIALGFLAFYLTKRNDSSSIRTELMDFAVKDTASINKIFIADRNGNQILLKRQEDNSWILNDKYPPRPDMMKNLLEVIHSVSVKSRVPKSGFNNVIADLSAGGIKCEIYTKNSEKPSKVYYVGNQTADALGTFMMIENSSVPFVMELPGFNGYLTPWYPAAEGIWIDPIIFSYNPQQIRQVSINYPAFPDRSFSLERKNNRFQLQIISTEKIYKDIDSVAVDNYLALFQRVYYEVPADKFSQGRRDSLIQSTPLNEIEVENISNQSQLISIYPMPINETSLTVQDSLGNPLKYDLDRMYGYLKAENKWVIIQHYSFDKLFRSGSDFMLKKRGQGKLVQ